MHHTSVIPGLKITSFSELWDLTLDSTMTSWVPDANFIAAVPPLLLDP